VPRVGFEPTAFGYLRSDSLQGPYESDAPPG